MNFASDNWSGASPKVRDAIARACEGVAPAYGADPLTAELHRRLEALFEHELALFLVPTGTAANALALATLCPPTGVVLAHEEAHIVEDECGAPEFFSGGARLAGLPGVAGRLTVPALEAGLARFPDQPRFQRPAVLSLTQATEAGTVYTLAQTAAMSARAHEHGLSVHMDGARLANALVALGASPAEVTWRAGIDVLSLGGTKAGALMAEAVLVFDKARVSDLDRRRKRGGHVVSKSRLIAAQLLALVDEGHWLDLAGHANAMAARLAQGLGANGAHLPWPTEANEVFCALPDAVLRRLKATGAAFYEWPTRSLPAPLPAGTVLVRLVASWSTTPEEVDRFVELAGG